MHPHLTINKNKKGKLMEKITTFMLGMLLVVFAGTPRLAFSQSSDERPAKDGVDDVMSRLVKISEHGNLKDDNFFGETMGIKMIGFSEKSTPITFYACGVSPGPVGDSIKYQYAQVPWFLGGADKHKKPCEYGYLKEIDAAGKVTKTVARLNILPDKVCITKSEINKYFGGIVPENNSKSTAVLYDFYGNNGIKLTLMFSLNRAYSSCVDLITIYQ